MAEMTRDQLLADFRKEFGAESIHLLGKTDKMDIEMRSSGSVFLDIALGGGYPKGRIIELSGKEKAGKTTLLLIAIAIAQVEEPDKENAIIDLEHSFNPDWAKTLGVDIDKLFVLQPNTSAESVYNQMIHLIKSGRFAYIGLDSVAGLVPQSEIDNDFDKDPRVGGTSKLNAQAMRKMINTGVLTVSGTTLVFINQLRDAIGAFSPFGTPTMTGGGRSLKHAYTQQLEVNLGEQFAKGSGADKSILGHRMKIKVSKNKVAPPYRTATLDLYYEQGVDKIVEIVNASKELGILAGTSWLKLVNPETGEVELDTEGKEIKFNGVNKTVDAIKEGINAGDSSLYEKLYNYVNYVIRG